MSLTKNPKPKIYFSLHIWSLAESWGLEQLSSTIHWGVMLLLRHMAYAWFGLKLPGSYGCIQCTKQHSNASWNIYITFYWRLYIHKCRYWHQISKNFVYRYVPVLQSKHIHKHICEHNVNFFTVIFYSYTGMCCASYTMLSWLPVLLHLLKQ